VDRVWKGALDIKEEGYCDFTCVPGVFDFVGDDMHHICGIAA
jgi:hypothetical protein